VASAGGFLEFIGIYMFTRFSEYFHHKKIFKGGLEPPITWLKMMRQKDEQSRKGERKKLLNLT